MRTCGATPVSLPHTMKFLEAPTAVLEELPATIVHNTTNTTTTKRNPSLVRMKSDPAGDAKRRPKVSKTNACVDLDDASRPVSMLNLVGVVISGCCDEKSCDCPDAVLFCIREIPEYKSPLILLQFSQTADMTTFSQKSTLFSKND